MMQECEVNPLLEDLNDQKANLMQVLRKRVFGMQALCCCACHSPPTYMTSTSHRSPGMVLLG